MAKVSRYSFFQFFLWFMVMISLSGCATILEGPHQKINLNCTPSEGIVFVSDGIEKPFMNGSLLLNKTAEDHFVTFRKEGYNESTVSFNREIYPWWPFADLIWGPAYPLALLVDWQTGSFYRFNPRSLNVVLRKKD